MLFALRFVAQPLESKPIENFGPQEWAALYPGGIVPLKAPSDAVTGGLGFTI